MLALTMHKPGPSPVAASEASILVDPSPCCGSGLVYADLGEAVEKQEYKTQFARSRGMRLRRQASVYKHGLPVELR